MLIIIEKSCCKISNVSKDGERNTCCKIYLILDFDKKNKYLGQVALSPIPDARVSHHDVVSLGAGDGITPQPSQPGLPLPATATQPYNRNGLLRRVDIICKVNGVLVRLVLDTGISHLHQLQLHQP